MSNDIKISLQKVGLTLGVVSGAFMLVWPVAKLPGAVAALERKHETLSIEQKNDHELLIQINERTSYIAEALKRMEAK